MKKLILFFFIFLMYPIYSQIVIEKYKNGRIKSQVNYLNEKLEGEFIYYYENGKTEKKGTYLDGIVDGEFIDYNTKGQIVTKTCYINGYKEEIENYYYKHGKLNNIWKSYPEEEFDDEYTTFYKNGKINTKGNYAGAFGPEGEWASYHKNGHIDGIINYIDGLVDGKVIHYYSNGQIFWIASYTQDHLNGEGITYYKNGQIKEQGNLSDKEIRTMWWFFDFSRIRILKEGEWSYFSKRGKVKTSKTYLHGKRIK